MKQKDVMHQSVFREHKSYSVKEILDAGGTTAFGIKTGKSMERFVERTKELPPIEPFTDDEWADLLIQMANDR